jgi:thiamine-monophosphate kinase
MPDDPDEPFVIDTILAQCGAPRAPEAEAHALPLLAAGDDAAMIDVRTAITVDTMVEGVHWDQRLSAEDVGWKLVAANASDINAMGGHPSWALLSIALPVPLDRAWVSSFARGLGAAMRQWQVVIAGGDTTRSPGPRMVSLSLAGDVPTPVGRHSARPGDEIWVSGPLGGPAAGFAMTGSANQALRRPAPPIGLGAALAETDRISAMMDLSDGLRQDLLRLCKASGVGAVIEPDRLPPHPDVLGQDDALSLMTGFGEEYELLFTAAPESAEAIKTAAARFDRQPVCIGQISADTVRGVRLRSVEWPELRFTHFGEA